MNGEKTERVQELPLKVNVKNKWFFRLVPVLVFLLKFFLFSLLFLSVSVFFLSLLIILVCIGIIVNKINGLMRWDRTETGPVVLTPFTHQKEQKRKIKKTYQKISIFFNFVFFSIDRKICLYSKEEITWQVCWDKSLKSLVSFSLFFLFWPPFDSIFVDFSSLSFFFNFWIKDWIPMVHTLFKVKRVYSLNGREKPSKKLMWVTQ